jgi:hypothetical protein
VHNGNKSNSGKIGQVVAMGGSGKNQDFFLWYEMVADLCKFLANGVLHKPCFILYHIYSYFKFNIIYYLFGDNNIIVFLVSSLFIEILKNYNLKNLKETIE